MHLLQTSNGADVTKVCYQSNITDGFHFIQTLWANNDKFVDLILHPCTEANSFSASRSTRVT
jgi:deferrochelatase/peroxidase EfeB